MNLLERLQRIGRVVFSLALKVSGMGLFWRGIVAKRDNLFVGLNNGAPFSVVVISPKQSASRSNVRPLLVLHVGATCGHAKVAEPVVVPYSINVINFAFWPRAVHIKPNQAMSRMVFVLNLPASIAQTAQASKWFFCCNTRGRMGAPEQCTGFRVIVQKLLDKSLRQARLFGNHAVVLHKRWFGKRSEAVCRSLGLRHFNMRTV